MTVADQYHKNNLGFTRSGSKAGTPLETKRAWRNKVGAETCEWDQVKGDVNVDFVEI